MGDNTLALFDAIRQRGRGMNELIEERLIRLGQDVGMTLDEIEDALFSDRNLVIYEP